MLKPADDSHEFKPLLVEIEERPLNPLGRTVFWLVIATLFSTVLWMLFGEVDVVVTARGKLIPSGEVKTIQPLHAGVVSNILVAPGDYVTRGQLLMEIDPSDVDPELTSLYADRNQAALEIERLRALLEERPFVARDSSYDTEMLRVQQEIYRSETERLKTQLELKRQTLVQLDERLAAEQKIAEQAHYRLAVASEKFNRLQQVKEIISRDNYEDAEGAVMQHQTDRKASQHRSGELIAKKQQTLQEIDYLNEEHRNRLLAELSEQTQRQLHLQARIEKAEFVSSRQQLTAPVNGYVSRLLFHTVGGVVTPAEELAYIVPTDSPLLVKAYLQNKDAGFVAEEMAASIKIDSFNFQKYGTIEGKVLQLSKDSIEDQQLGLVYEMYIAPDSNTLQINGVETEITAGMSVTSEVKVGKRRIIEFFIYPLIKYLDEGVSVM